MIPELINLIQDWFMEYVSIFVDEGTPHLSQCYVCLAQGSDQNDINMAGHISDCPVSRLDCQIQIFDSYLLVSSNMAG